MTPANERKKNDILSWLVPALLAGITALLTLGGTNMLSYMRDTHTEMVNLRKDVQESSIQTEKRLTRLEDIMLMNHGMLADDIKLDRDTMKKIDVHHRQYIITRQQEKKP